jgi:hypothetical protein
VTVRPSRRDFVAGTIALSVGCKKSEPERPAAVDAEVVPARQAVDTIAPEGSPGPGGPLFDEKEIDFDDSTVGREKAVAIVPRWRPSGARFPVLVALHGRGEAVRGIDVGAHGWLHDYELGRCIARLREPPLARNDFKGFVNDERLARINESLAERPFRGLIVLCPWVPDLVNERDRTNLDASLPFGRFVVDRLLPRALDETPALTGRAATGIDGVSLGGRVALVVGLAHPDRFGAIGAIQPAIQENEPPLLARRAREATVDAGSLRLRIVTSDRDYFRGAVAGLHLALAAERIDHEHLVLPGPHDYAFNRGPGGFEMLLWHDRVLRGEPPL